MRRKILFIAVLLSFSLFFPSYLSAEESDERQNGIEDNDAEMNELGIKKGTMVYGEDISKLSEEELQYVPEGWRDGVFQSEHPEEEIDYFSIMPHALYPNVNNYIKNLKVPKVSYEHKNKFTKFNYRNGFGAVEGVVAHETANDHSNIRQEIAYMSRNHKNAFVHAFVDHENIIEIHPLDYGAWGAGRYANQRFVHVELTRVHNFDQFARSINNYADYIANILYDYNLGVSNAENSGKGTLWSHKAVSLHLGGTNHVDPHGYFAKYGYTWNQFVSLVTEKHNNLVASGKANTSKLGHIKSSNVRIYKDPTNLNAYTTAGAKNLNEVFYIKAEAKLRGTNYYLLSRQPSSKNGTIGWVKASDINAHAHKGKDRKKRTLQVKGSGKAYNKAWGGSKNLVYDLSSYAGKTFKVNLTETVGNNVWYRGTLAGKTVWIHSSYVSNIVESKTSKLGHIRNSGVNIYDSIYDNSTSFKAGTKYTNKVYYIKKQAKSNGDTFYLISNQPSSSKGVVGWVNAKDLSIHNHTGVDKERKKFTISGKGNAYTKAWGGSSDLVDKLAGHAGKEFHVNLTEKIGNNVWYRGTLDGKRAWIHSSYLISKESTSKLGHLKNTEVKIYSDLTNNSSTFKAGEQYTNTVYYIKQQAQLKGVTYFQLSTKPSGTKGVVGWVKSKDVSTHSHVGVDKKTKTLYFTGKGKAYSRAWGGAKDLVIDDMSQYTNQKFQVNLTEKVGNNIWYRGKFNGETIWLHSGYVATKEENNTSKLGHLKSGALIYETIGDKSSSISSDNYLNAVYYIKKQAKLNGKTYYLISTKPSRTDGIVGWVESKHLSTHSHVSVDKDSKTFYFTGKGKAYSKAWGGAKDLVIGDMSQYINQEFNVHLTEKVGNNTWYRGSFNGERIWVHSSYVK